MRRTTRKISGPALGRYLERFFADEPGMPAATAEHLAMRARSAISSIRVRANPVAVAGEKAAAAQSRAALGAKSAVTGTAPGNNETSRPPVTEPAKPATQVQAAPPKMEAGEASAFDAYAIGLVPTFQREGRDGLIGKLAEIASADNLRKMARAQQIVLPEGLRQGDVALDELRAAIADSVAKRIADRRAAAR